MLFLRQSRRLFATSHRQKLQQLRNIDYQALRKQAVKQYNQSITSHKNQYLQEIQKYHQREQQATLQSQQAHIQKEHHNFMQAYIKTLENNNSQLTLKLREIDTEESTNTVKVYLVENLAEQNNETLQSPVKNQKNKMYIPNNMVIKKMYHSKKGQVRESSVNKQILLLGVEKEEEHCFYISKVIDQFNIKNVITMIPPNLPFFIKTERSHLEEWEKFITNTEYARKCKFYLNPLPKTLNDVCLNKHHIPLIKQALSKSSSFLENFNLMLQQNEISKRYEPAPLLTCLFPQGVQKIFFADYPAYEERRMIADSTPLPRLRQLYQQHLYHIKNGKYNFSAQWLFPKEVLSKKLNHLNGIIRAVSQSCEGRSLVLCPAQMAQLISIQWQLSKDGRLNYNYQDNNYYFNLAHSHQTETQQQTFIEFIEKLVILDIIMEPIFTKYFVKYKSFPFMCEHTIGGKQNIGKIFIVWMHYYKIYYQSLTEKKLESQVAKQKRKEYESKFQKPENIY